MYTHSNTTTQLCIRFSFYIASFHEKFIILLLLASCESEKMLKVAVEHKKSPGHGHRDFQPLDLPLIPLVTYGSRVPTTRPCPIMLA